MAKNLTGKSDTLTLTVTPGLLAHLEALTLTHLYGTKAAETAEIIVKEEMRRLLASGQYDTFKSRLPKLSTDETQETAGANAATK